MPYIVSHDDDGGIRSEECYGPDVKYAIYTMLPEAEQACAGCQHEANMLALDGDDRWSADGYHVERVSDGFDF